MKFLMKLQNLLVIMQCVYFLQTGSHFLRQADWGCHDGEHKAWLIVEAENKDQAIRIIPSLFRSDAKIIKLHTFTSAEMEKIEEVHPV